MISLSGKLSALAALFAWATASGCIQPPAVSVVDNRTALEIQASGEYPELEFRSVDASLQPRPSPVSASELISEAGLAAAGPNLDLFAVSQGDAEFIDIMLLSGCLGEAQDGLLEYMPDRCTGTTEVSELRRVASRDNLRRRQVWEYLASTGKARSTAAARDAWRSVHLEQVRCGVWIQRDGEWAQKAC